MAELELETVAPCARATKRHTGRCTVHVRDALIYLRLVCSSIRTTRLPFVSAPLAVRSMQARAPGAEGIAKKERRGCTALLANHL